MYFCILHSKQYEMLALRELAPEIVASGCILPVIEPVAIDRNLEIALDKFVEATMQFCLIVNPEAGGLTQHTLAQIKTGIFEAFLDEYDNVFPAYNVAATTTVAQIDAFCAAFTERRVFYLLAAPAEPVIDAILKADPEYVMFLRGSVSAATKARFAPEISVDIAEDFHAAATNADFPDDEFFSEGHIALPSGDFHHFGDYSIIGRTLGGGWAPYCVVIHYPYLNAADSDRLYIKHYKSDTNDTQDDPAGKYSEALAKLIADVPGLGHKNQTSTTNEFEADSIHSHYPGLATLKKRGITHQIRLLTTVL